MHHKVCLSSLPQCINASSTTALPFQQRKDSRCLTGLKQAVPPPFSRSACAGAQPLLNAGNCVKAQVVLLAVSFRYPFLWVSSPLDFGWERKSTIFFFVFYLGNLVIRVIFPWHKSGLQQTQKRTEHHLHFTAVKQCPLETVIHTETLSSFLCFTDKKNFCLMQTLYMIEFSNILHWLVHARVSVDNAHQGVHYQELMDDGCLHHLEGHYPTYTMVTCQRRNKFIHLYFHAFCNHNLKFFSSHNSISLATPLTNTWNNHSHPKRFLCNGNVLHYSSK